MGIRDLRTQNLYAYDAVALGLAFAQVKGELAAGVRVGKRLRSHIKV